MKIPILDSQGKKSGEIELPQQFNEKFRPDLIKRSVVALEANSRQKYGAKHGAGMRHSAKVSKRRRKYRGCYGIGIARSPRKVMSRRGTRMNWVGAIAPNTVGGRRAHPPKPEKNWDQKVNEKERRKAICSCLAATMNPALVQSRGHIVPKGYPFGFDSSFESLEKTKDIYQALIKNGLIDELNRTQYRNIRAGKGKMRGRKYKSKIGPLIVVGDGRSKISKAARNIPGIDVVSIKSIKINLLAPGSAPGRMSFFTADAIKNLSKGRLFQ